MGNDTGIRVLDPYEITPEGFHGQAVTTVAKQRALEGELDDAAIEAAIREQRIIQARVSLVQEGRAYCRLNSAGVYAVIPPDQFDMKARTGIEGFTGREIQFIPLAYSREERLVPSSRKRAVELKAPLTWAELQPGRALEGVVRSVHDKVAYLDLGGVTALLPISEVDFQYISGLREVLRPGQLLPVAVKEVDQEKHECVVTHKGLYDNPWDEAVRLLKPGPDSIAEGRVVSVHQFPSGFVGVFIQLIGLKGVEGLAKFRPQMPVAAGDKVRVRVVSIDPVERRIGLWIRNKIAEAV